MASDKTPPCDVGAEQAVLGAAMLDTVAADVCIPVLAPIAFYRQPHRAIWSAICALRADGKPCDVILVAEVLTRDGALDKAGGLSYLSDLIGAVPATANARHYAEIVLRLYVRREALQAAAELSEAANEADATAEDLIGSLQAGMRRVSLAAAAATRTQHYDEGLPTVFQRIEEVYAGKVRPGMSTGMPQLDYRLGGGMHRKELIVIAGRPGEGKSQLMQFLAHHQRKADNRRILVLSAEMDFDMLTERGLAMEAGINSLKFRGSPKMADEDWPSLSRGIGLMSEIGSNLEIDDSVTTMEACVARARQVHAEAPLDVVYIDHLHHLKPPKGFDKRADAFGEMTREAKELAKSLNVAVVLLAQLNREAVKAGERPQLHHLRESGYIEQLADAVVFLWTPKASADPGRVPLLVESELVIAKARNGRPGVHEIEHHRPTGRFRDRQKSGGAGQAS